MQRRLTDDSWEQTPPEQAVATVDMAAVERLVGRLRRDKTEAMPFGRHEWGKQIRKCFPTAEPTGAANWNHGGLDFDASATGVRMFAVLDD